MIFERFKSMVEQLVGWKNQDNKWKDYTEYNVGYASGYARACLDVSNTTCARIFVETGAVVDLAEKKNLLNKKDVGRGNETV